MVARQFRVLEAVSSSLATSTSKKRLDFSNRFSLSFVLSNAVRVEIGALKDMNVKLTLVEEELNKNPVNHNIYAVIDVSNTTKPIWRQINAENLFD